MEGTALLTSGLDPVHDERHRLDDRPHARESLVWTLKLPEEGVAAAAYTWVDGAGRAGALLAAFGPGVGPEPLVEAVDGVEVPADQGFDDWRVGALRARQREPLARAEVSFDGQRAGLEYRFEALHPAYAYGAHGGGCPSFLADERFEQSGRVRGVLRVAGRELPFDALGHRDHSWGVRDWGAAQHWKWIECQAEPGEAVHVMQIHALGRTWLRGYVFRDGELAPVTGLDDVDFAADERLLQTSLQTVAHDAAGRSTPVRGEVFAMWEFGVSPLAMLNEGAMAVEIDGRPGVGHVEMCWPRAYLEHLRDESRSESPGAVGSGG